MRSYSKPARRMSANVTNRLQNCAPTSWTYKADSVCRVGQRARIENGWRGRPAKEGLHAAFGFPLKLDDQVLGVIEFFSRQILPPDEDLLRMMATIGAQVGQFIVRKRTEEALAAEHNLLRTLIDSLPDAIYIKDTQSRFILGTKGVARIMGAPGSESLVGKTDFDFYPAELAERYCADERAVLDSGQPLINREEPVVDPSGRRGWLLTTKAPLRDTRGRVVGLVGMGRDITD